MANGLHDSDSPGASRIIIRGTALIVALCALALLGPALVGPGTLREIVSPYSPDHQVGAEFLHNVAVRGSICAFVLMLIAAAITRAESVVTDVLHDLARCRHSYRIDPTLLFIMSCGALARLVHLNAPMRYDEAFTIHEFVMHSPFDFLSRYSHPNDHLFHTLLVWMVSRVTGFERWTLRLPAFIAGVLVIGATARAAGVLHGRRIALLAAGLATGAAPLVEFSIEARGYTIVTLGFLLLFTLVPSMHEGKSLTPWAAATLIGGLCAWTIPTTLFAVASFLAWLFKTTARSLWPRIVKFACACGALTFILYLPVLVVSGPAAITANGNVTPKRFAVLAPMIWGALTDTWHFWNASWPIAVAITLSALAALTSLRTRDPLAIALIAVLAVVVVIRNVAFPRVWTFLLPLYLIAAAAGLGRLVRSDRILTAVALITAALASMAGAWEVLDTTVYYGDPATLDIPEIAKFVKDSLPPDARVIVMTPLDSGFAYEFDRLGIPGRLVQFRFEVEPAAARQEILAAPRRFVVLGDAAKFRELDIRASLRLIRSFPHATLYEIVTSDDREHSLS